MKWIRRIGILLSALMILFVIGALVYVNDMKFAQSEERIQQTFSNVPYELHSDIVEYDGRPIHFMEIGAPEKPVVLFVHGSPGMWDHFMDQMSSPALLEQVRMISVNRLGYGKSGEGQPEPSLQKQAASLLHVLDLLSPDSPAVLVGFSYGGPVVARMAMDAPGRVASLVLLGASIDPTLEKIKWYQYPAAVPPISWLIPPDLLVCNRELLALKGELEAMVPLWQRIRHPVTVIHGVQDDLVPVANAEFAERMLVNAPVRMKRFPKLNHFVHWTHPQIVIESILDQVGAIE